MTDIQTLIQKAPFILTEGAIVERLRRESPFELHPLLVHADFIYDTEKRSYMESLYRQYIDIARLHQLPIIIYTPTWRTNHQRIEQSNRLSTPINGDCYRFLDDIRNSYGDAGPPILIAGDVGCKGDAYKAEEALSTGEARLFHQYQANALAQAGVDFLFGVTLPAVSEALGMAHAFALTGKPYMLSFMIRPDGKLLDGTLIHNAIELIDASLSFPPLGYCCNCIHPAIFIQALQQEENLTELVRHRLIGLQANTSCKSPEELDGSAELHCEDPDRFAELMLEAHREFGLKILGGCCGTNEFHISALAEKLSHQE